MKKSSYKELADYLNVSVSAVSSYNSKKRLIMLIGLYALGELRKKEKQSLASKL